MLILEGAKSTVHKKESKKISKNKDIVSYREITKKRELPSNLSTNQCRAAQRRARVPRTGSPHVGTLKQTHRWKLLDRALSRPARTSVGD